MLLGLRHVYFKGITLHCTGYVEKHGTCIREMERFLYTSDTKCVSRDVEKTEEVGQTSSL